MAVSEGTGEGAGGEGEAMSVGVGGGAQRHRLDAGTDEVAGGRDMGEPSSTGDVGILSAGPVLQESGTSAASDVEGKAAKRLKEAQGDRGDDARAAAASAGKGEGAGGSREVHAASLWLTAAHPQQHCAFCHEPVSRLFGHRERGRRVGAGKRGQRRKDVSLKGCLQVACSTSSSQVAHSPRHSFAPPVDSQRSHAFALPPSAWIPPPSSRLVGSLSCSRTRCPAFCDAPPSR